MVRVRRSAVRLGHTKVREMTRRHRRAAGIALRKALRGARLLLARRHGATDGSEIAGAASSRGLVAGNRLVAVAAVAVMVAAVSATLLWPRTQGEVSAVRDSSGNDISRAAIGLPAMPGLERDLALRSAGTANAHTPYTGANGDAVPTDPVRFASLPLADPARAALGRAEPPRDIAHSGDGSGTGAGTAPTEFNGKALIAEARRYLGTNPTKRATLWCGAFLDMVLRKTGHRGGGNLALAYARYGKRIPGPKVGAIVVLRRNGGGHVGIVTGIDSNGNPIVISGNHNRRVAISTYPRSRVVAYVIP